MSSIRLLVATATLLATAAMVSPPASNAAPWEGQQVAQSETACINGYRFTHVVRSGGRTTGGVPLRCRG